MKRLWFAVIFLVIALGCCLGEQLFLENFHDEMNSKIIVAEKEPSIDNINKIKDYWKNSNWIMNAICDSARLNELNQAIIFLSDDDKEIGASLADVRAINDSYYEAQQISLGNIF